MTAYRNYGENQTLAEFTADFKKRPTLENIADRWGELIGEPLLDNFRKEIVNAQFQRHDKFDPEAAAEQAKFKGDMSGACCYFFNTRFDSPQSIPDIISRIDTLESLQNAMAQQFNLSGQADSVERDRTRMMMANVVANVMHGVPVDEVLHNIRIENNVPDSLYGGQNPEKVMERVATAFKREELAKRISPDFTIQGLMELGNKNENQYRMTSRLLGAIQTKLEASGISLENASPEVLAQVAALPKLLNNAGFTLEAGGKNDPATTNFAVVTDAVAEAVVNGKSLVTVLMKDQNVQQSLGRNITGPVSGSLAMGQSSTVGNHVIPSNKPPAPAHSLFGGI